MMTWENRLDQLEKVVTKMQGAMVEMQGAMVEMQGSICKLEDRLGGLIDEMFAAMDEKFAAIMEKLSNPNQVHSGSALAHPETRERRQTPLEEEVPPEMRWTEAPLEREIPRDAWLPEGRATFAPVVRRMELPIFDGVDPLAWTAGTEQCFLVQETPEPSKVAALYPFHGPRKISAVRVFAAALNCLSHEIDKPCGLCRDCILFLSGRFKVYIVDDGHLLRGETWAALFDKQEERSDTRSEMGKPMNNLTKKKKKMKFGVTKKKKKKKKRKFEDGIEEEEKEENLNAVSNFRISARLRETLEAKGIEALFTIQAMTIDVLFTTCDIVLIDQDFLSQFPWHYAMADEAQRLKNPSSVLYTVLRELLVMPRKLPMTGTPIQNNLTELWALMHFCMPLILGTLEQFLSDFNEAGDPSSGQGAQKVKEQFKILKYVLGAFMLRRTKSKLMESGTLLLPPVTEITVMAPLSPLQKKVYMSILRKELPKRLALAYGGTNAQSLHNIVIQLRKACSHPYLFPGIEPEPYQEGEHQDFLEMRKYTYERLDGSIRAEERFAAIRNFSIKSSANIDTHQSTQRAHRIGQSNHVLSTERTVEEVIMRRARRKLQLSHNVNGDEMLDREGSNG